MTDRRGLLGLVCVCSLWCAPMVGAQPQVLPPIEPDVPADVAPEVEPAEVVEPDVAADAPSTGQVIDRDGTLDEGEVIDLYEVQVQQGHHLIVNVRTLAFDAFLSVVSPGGEVWHNDDWNLTNTHSHIHLVAEESGVWRVRVAGFDVHQFGPYRIDVYTGPESPDGSRPPLVERGTLAEGDDEVSGAPGRYMDRFPIDGVLGEHLTIDLTSRAFDTFVILEQDATGRRWENDDFQTSQSMSHLGVTLPEAGAYTVIVTSFSAKESGGYDLLVQRGTPPPTPVADNTEEHAGELAAGDDTRADGAYIDRYELECVEGEELMIDLRSSAFDTHLSLVQAGEVGGRWENDDAQAGDTTHSRLELTVPADGVYTVVASSYDRGETGAYDLTVARVAPRETELIEGELAAGDATHRQGEWVDWIDVPTEPGQVVEVFLESAEFDTYLILATPTGATLENDDYEGDSSRSHVLMHIERPGVHRVGVTSFAPEMAGAYTLDIRITAAPDPRAQRDITHLAAGDTVRGSIAYGDVTTDRGTLADRYSFDADAGQRVVIDLTASHFDTFLSVTAPNGDVLTNDDFDGQGHSRLAFDAEQSGPYRLTATSYMADQIGDYQLALDILQRAEVPIPDVPGRRVYGLFIGISDYGGFGDLPFCVEDATRLHDSLREKFGMLPEDAILLTDQKATLEAVEQALADLADRASADDTLVVFYSGHGGQQPIEQFTAQDPDAKDETLVLVDGEMTDDRFAELLAPVRAGTQLIVLDACFAGGFAKDVVSVPGRMGVFSSEEDVLSMVAARFRAGGYLAMFMDEAFGERRDEADLNSDRMLTALELSHYLDARYAEIVVQPKPIDQYLETEEVNPGVNLSFQKLVADRGGVSPNHVLLRW